MLLKDETVTVVKKVEGLKVGDKLKVRSISPVELEREGKHVGCVIEFDNDKVFPISLLEEGYIKTQTKTEENIKNWFK